jgi:hypothetical protein
MTPFPVLFLVAPVRAPVAQMNGMLDGIEAIVARRH